MTRQTASDIVDSAGKKPQREGQPGGAEPTPGTWAVTAAGSGKGQRRKSEIYATSEITSKIQGAIGGEGDVPKQQN